MRFFDRMTDDGLELAGAAFARIAKIDFVVVTRILDV